MAITLDLAGWRMRLDCHPAALAAEVAVRYAPFLSDGAASHLVMRVLMEGSPGVSVPQSGRQNALAPHAPHLSLRGRKIGVDTAEFHGIIDLDSNQARVNLGGPAPLAGLEYFLRVGYALLAEANGGLLFHAAGLVSGGGAHVFAGPSGSGKSTVASLALAAVVLNDDLVLVRPAGAGWVVHGTPFWNAATVSRDGQTAAAPLVAIYRLVQDREVYLEPLTSAAAAAELVANCPVVNSDPYRLPSLLDRCHRVASAVPVQRLHFRRDHGFWDLARGLPVRTGIGRGSA